MRLTWLLTLLSLALPPSLRGSVPLTPDSALHLARPQRVSHCFIVIAKRDLSLSVYEARPASGDTLFYLCQHGTSPLTFGPDTVLIARYPVCLSRDKGQKRHKGDMRTPHSQPGPPFYITQIQDASTWRHDFGDGRGSILAYGHWFLRLHTPGHGGIGIHGSTGNEDSVPGRASEGCIRLRDDDIIDLHDRYAHVGMTVIIKDEDEGPLSFEADDK